MMTGEEFFTRFGAKLTASQREAVESVDGAVLVLAVPGSGKTTALILRLGYMLLVRGIAPERTLTMTYTVAATVEMRERFRALFGSEYADRLEFRTINGVSAKIIGYYGRTFGKRAPFALCDSEADLIAIIRRAYSAQTGEYADDGTVKELRSAITYAKNMMLSAEELSSVEAPVKDFPALFSAYCDALRSRRLMDYDDQMVYAYTILQKNESVLSFFRETYPYISVDEAQDTSKIQHAIIALLAGERGNIFMVGDEDQSIYGFRAAYPEALMTFGGTYPGARIIKMEDNFRTADEIIAAANLFISCNKNRYEKTMRPTRGVHSPISVARALTREAQYKLMAELAKRETGECAVLYRNNESALPLIDIMERENIPYSCRKFDDSFFTSRVVSDVVDIISFAFDPTDTERFMRIYYKLGSLLTKEQAKAACESARRTGQNILISAQRSCRLSKYAADAVSDVIADLGELKISTAANAVLILRLRLGYAQYAERSGIDLGKLDILSLIAEYQPDALALLRRLEELRRIIAEHENSGGVTLSTIHSAKGLEFSKVYIIDVMDGILPSVPCEKDEALYEEERRLFYVAMTRAKDELCLFSFSKREEFVLEVTENIPREVMSDALIGAAMNTVGKKYAHAVFGEGIVKAQVGDRHLIEFSGGRSAFLTLSEMLANRERTFRASVREKPVSGKTASPEDFKPGQKVEHTAFGRGVVLTVSGDVAAVRFFRDNVIRRLGLKLCAANGILSIEE